MNQFRFPPVLFFLLVVLVFNSNLEAQKRRRNLPANRTILLALNSKVAVVVDERLAVLRKEPSLFADSIQRMRRGRTVTISGSKQADGVLFYRVNAAPNNYGWVQSDAVIEKFKKGEDARLAKLAQSSEGFEQVERAQIFLDNFPDSPLRPAMLLLVGDLMEETALKLSIEATRRLDRREMAASGAPLHSFYLNYTSLDRYRRLGIGFLFNPTTKLFHYDGANWREIVKRFSNSNEAVEAQKRLVALKEKMDAVK